MQKHHGNWCRVTRQEPCPVCGKPDNCVVSADGGAVWCGRVSEGALRQNGGGQYLHRLNATACLSGQDRRFVHVPQPPKRFEKVVDWTTSLAFYAKGAPTGVPVLAERLGVSVESLTALNAGWHPGHKFWTHPERDGFGRVIGVITRYEDGSKKRLSRSKCGLSYADSWDTGLGPILLVEGPSDTAALLTLGLTVVGRPSNCGGVDLLIDLLFDVPTQREIVVVGERDEKPDGKWPGRDGAISTATRLAEALERPVGWAFPPDNAKDSRAWLKAMPELPNDRLADLFITGIDTKQVLPPITIRIEPEPTITLPLGKWRDNMLQARLHSLGKPGVYLDRSPTGSGKSYVDFAAVQALLQREGAA